MVSITPIGDLTTSKRGTQGDATALRRIYRSEARKALRRYQRTVRTWSKKPDFKLTPSGDLGFEVGTDNQIYQYVDEGTRPHIIRPKGFMNGGADRLRFQVGYKAKTTPGSLRSRQGGKFGEFRTSLGVKHPGTEARDFTKRIQKEAQVALEKDVTAWLKSQVR